MATLILLFPLRTPVVPSWTVLVTDPSGAPIVGAVVRQQWKYEPFDSERHEASDMTRENGAASFPSRNLRMCLAERAFGLAMGLLRREAHPDWGRYSLIVAAAPGFQAASVAYQPGELLPVVIRLRRLVNSEPVVTQ